MNKFLLIILIVVVASTEVQHLDMRKLGNTEPLYKWFMKQKIYPIVVIVARTDGRPKAIAYCKNKAPSFLQFLCPDLIDNILK